MAPIISHTFSISSRFPVSPINILSAVCEGFGRKVTVGNMSFEENLRFLRRRAGMTQGQLAHCIRLRRREPSRCYVTQLESGRIDPRLSTVRSIAKALHVKPWYLVADLSDNVTFWEAYLQLSPTQKREVQRMIDWQLDRRGR
jgi:transcriptional regulator with XRE-family HTH domain